MLKLGRGIIFSIAVIMSLFHLYTGFFGSFEAYMQRILHLSFGVTLLYLTLLFPDSKKPIDEEASGKPNRAWMSRGFIWTLLAIFLVSQAYLLINYNYFARQRFPYVTDLTPMELIFGLGFILVIMDVTRRTMGWGMTILAVIFFFYPMAGPYLPGIFHHSGKPLSQFVDNLVYTTDGIFGIPLGISATYLFLFVIFSSFLNIFGFDKLLLNLASGISGKMRGGPAKICIISSGITGMFTGSAVANVVTAGSFSIPLMIRAGYKREYAGAIEAAASTGGQFLPPVMGAQAFIMAQFTGISYVQIAMYSLVPALLYYIGIWFSLDMEARKLGLKGLSLEEVGDWRGEMVSRIHLVIPFFVLIYFLAIGKTAMFSVIYSIVALLIIGLLRKNTRPNWRKVLNALSEAAHISLTVVTASAISGVIIGAITLTGLGERFTGLMVDLSVGNLTLALLLAMLASLILGMGLPTIPAYIVQVSILVPALIEMGLSPVQAHLFAIYFSCISMITPPVAIAAFAAASISGGNAFKIGLLATQVGIVAFIVPFMFAYDPALLLIGSADAIVWAILKALVCIFALALSLQGFFHSKLSAVQRLLVLIASFLLVANIGVLYDTTAIGLVVVIFIWQRKAKDKLILAEINA